MSSRSAVAWPCSAPEVASKGDAKGVLAVEIEHPDRLDRSGSRTSQSNLVILRRKVARRSADCPCAPIHFQADPRAATSARTVETLRSSFLRCSLASAFLCSLSGRRGKPVGARSRFSNFFENAVRNVLLGPSVFEFFPRVAAVDRGPRESAVL